MNIVIIEEVGSSQTNETYIISSYRSEDWENIGFRAYLISIEKLNLYKSWGLLLCYPGRKNYESF